MAQVKANFFHRTSFLIVVVFFVSSAFICTLLLIFFYHGVPIHDARMWILKRAYSRVEHPVESTVLADAVYLGGPDTHGSWRCNYVVGEVRSAPLPKQEIREVYEQKTLSVAFLKSSLPLTVLFFDDEWPNELPWFTWKDEFISFEKVSHTPYLVYGAQKGVPFLGDLRCDD